MLERYGSANNVYEKLGQVGVADMFKAVSPDTYDTLDSLRDRLDSAGLLILSNTELDHCSDNVAQLSAIAIASVFGCPTKTDRRNKQIAWPIRYDPEANMVRTFSQSLGEAAYHTDTQYFEEPERYFGLFCVNADERGRETNRLIDGRGAIDLFESRYGGEEVARLGLQYPFRVPSVFTYSSSDDDVELTWAPIYNPTNQRLRYRKDTIMSALGLPQVDIPHLQCDTLRKFDSMLHDMKPIEYHLRPGEALLVDNHRMLHARNAFSNPNRFLYRVRMKSE